MASPSLSANDKVKAVEDIIGYKFTDPTTLHEALLAAGVYSNAAPYRIDSNKHLAQIGNAAIRLSLTFDGYKVGAGRGRINDVISAKASNAYVAERGFKSGLDRFVTTNPSQGGVVFSGVMATTVEAIIGAIYVDSARDTLAVPSVMAILDLAWPAEGSRIREQAVNVHPPANLSEHWMNGARDVT